MNYTFFMRKIKLFILLIFSFGILGSHAQNLILNESFDYPAGDSLAAHGWNVHSQGINTISIKTSSLSYPQYPASVGNKCFMKNTGQDINKTFAGQNSGTIYLSALVKVDTASVNGEYFLHFIRSGTNFNERVYVKKATSTSNLLAFGILKGTNAGNIVYSSAVYPMDSTYLLVIRYKFMSGSGNDSVSLFINPQYTHESNPTVKVSDITSTDLDSVYAVALRQGSTTNNNYINIDEIRISNSWYTALGINTSPLVSTTSAGSITNNSAVCNANVIADGGSVITARGICYDTVSSPTLANLFTIESGTTGAFSSNINNLMAGKTYYYRAYATNINGTVYGNELSFTTSDTAVFPIVITNAANNISHYAANLNANVLNDGGSTILSRGFCWGNNANPSLTDSVVYISGSIGLINFNLQNLLQNTTYNVRAFATNAVGTSYGANVSFKTLIFVPSYSIEQIHHNDTVTGAADSLNVNCKLSGVVHGLNYATAGYSFYIMNQNEGIFVYKTTSLGYTVAEGDSLRVIGKIQQYSGLTSIVPDSIVKISSANTLQNPISVNVLSESLESRLVSINNLTYLNGWPTTAGTTKLVYALSGSDTVNIVIFSGCNIQGTPAPGTTFNIKGIVTQSDNSSPYFQSYYLYPRYLSDLTINYTTPGVVTNSATNITMYAASLTGNITSNGGSAITSRGICYATTANPDTSALHSSENPGTGVFVSNITGLTPSVTYHYRAYAINNTGIAYGADSVFTTLAAPVIPAVVTDSVYNIWYNNVNVAANVINDGGATITSRGICWGLNTNPNINDSVIYANGTLGSFNVYINNLTHNTTYYVRAFAANSAGISYGNQLSYTTKKIIPDYNISNVKGVNADGVADSVNVNCRLTGVVHGINYKSTSTFSGLNFFIIDSTAGINVYKTSNLNYTPVEGDKVKVIGKIAQVNGLTEIVPDSVVLISTGNTLNTPQILNLPTESLESGLVKIENLYYLSGWPTTVGTTKTVYAVKGSDTVVIRIYTNCNLQGTQAPTATVSFSITGMLYQSDASLPYNTGYQILPRTTSDLLINFSNPTVITGTTSGITPYSAICSGSIPTDGGYVITSRGICYDTVADPITADSVKMVTGTTGNFTANLSNLLLGTTYHYRAFVINQLGTFYGADSVFTTSASSVVPVVTTSAATSIGFTNATVGGNIISNGGDTIINKGICWSITQNPTIADSVVYITSSLSSFSNIINNLTHNTVYYARAFASNAVGVGYGNEIAFTTKRLPPLYNIAQIKGVNASGVADSLNVNCKLSGVVHGINFKQTITFAGLNFFLLDQTAGINVYKTTNLSYTPVEGDSVRVIGKIAQVSGLTEIVPDSIVLISSANQLHQPLTITNLSENYESQLVKLQNLTYVSGWPSVAGIATSTVYALKGSDTISIRLYSNCNLQSIQAPSYVFNLSGFVGQLDNSSPYTSAYVLIPRDSNDIQNAVGITDVQKNNLRIYPNPADNKVNIISNFSKGAELRIYNMLGNIVYNQNLTANVTVIDVSEYKKGVYFVNILEKSSGKSVIEKLIIH